MAELIFVSASVSFIMVCWITILQIRIYLMLLKVIEEKNNPAPLKMKSGEERELFVDTGYPLSGPVGAAIRVYGHENKREEDDSVVLMTEERDDQILGFNKPDEDE